MSSNVWVHVSVRLPDGAAPKAATEIVWSCLSDEGIDDAMFDRSLPKERAVATQQGVDGATRLVCGSVHPVVLRGDEEALIPRLQGALEAAFASQGLAARARVVLRIADDVEPYLTSVLHLIDCDHGAAIEGKRDDMREALLPALVRRYAELETREQQAALIYATCDQSSAILAPVWRDFLFSPVETPKFDTGVCLSLQTSLAGLMGLAQGARAAKGIGLPELSRIRQHLLAGGGYPIKRWIRTGEPRTDFDLSAQLEGDAGPDVSTEELLWNACEAPEDDEPRRALAAAIEARNPTFARFITVGLEIASHRRRGHVPPEALVAEERAIDAEHGSIWNGPFEPLVRQRIYRRGLVEELMLEPDRLPTLISSSDGLLPLLDLALLPSAHGRIRELLDRGQLSKLRSLRLRGHGLDDDDAEALAACAPLAALRALNLENNAIGLRGLRALAKAFRKLRWLGFAGNAIEEPQAPFDAPEAGPSDTGRSLLAELGPLPWIESPLVGPTGGAPHPELL